MNKYVLKAYKRIKVFFAIRSARTDTLEHLANINSKNILVMCYGNIYRSPFVGKYLENKLPADFNVRSAGFFSRGGRASAQEYVDLALKYHVDLSVHASVVVDQFLVDWADIIIIMDRHNWHRLFDFGQCAIDKVVWLGALLDDRDVEISDPYGKSIDETELLVKKLLSGAEKFASKLVQQK